MTAPTARQVCEFDQFASPRGCRKRATTAVLYWFLFGHRLGGKGEEAIYGQDITYRCADHLDVADTLGTAAIEDVRRAYAERAAP